jgi:hypothetical protein
MSIGHDFDLLRDVVEYEQRLGQQNRKVRQTERILAAGGHVLARLDHIVTKVPDGSADKAGEIRHGHRTIGLHEFMQSVQRVALTGNSLAARASLNDEIATILDHEDRRSAAEEGVAGPLFPSLDAFEQIGGRTMIDLREGLDRRFMVGQDFAIQRNQVAVLCIGSEIFET